MKQTIRYLILFSLSLLIGIFLNAAGYNDSLIKITYIQTFNNPPSPESSQEAALYISGSMSYYCLYPGSEGKDGKIHARPYCVKDRDQEKISFWGPMLPKYPSDSYWSDSLPPMRWQVLNEFKTINSVPCQKARTFFRGREYFAYFATGYPIQDGPWKFCGLPGLIIKVEDSKGIYGFEATKFEMVPNRYQFNVGVVKGDYGNYKKLFKNWHMKKVESERARKAADPSCLDCSDVSKNSYSFYENLLD